MAGRPSWLSTDKDRDMVGSMAAYRIPQDAIAAVPKINKPTVLRRCRHEVDVGFAEINAVAREIDVSGGDERSLLGTPLARSVLAEMQRPSELGSPTGPTGGHHPDREDGQRSIRRDAAHQESARARRSPGCGGVGPLRKKPRGWRRE